jgi:hypothetical protein
MKKLFGEKTESIATQMEHIVDMTSKLFVPTPYPENKSAFEVFGYDFIIGEDYHVYLMEVNDKSGLAFEIDELFNAIIYVSERLL